MLGTFPVKFLTLGVSGTQTGMTRRQTRVVSAILERLNLRELHHGGCIGVDAQVHEMAMQLHPEWKGIRCPIRIHPSIYNGKRALCEYGLVLQPRPNLERNMDIVSVAELMLIVPKEEREVLRSGTWASYRYAKQQGKQIYLILPSGRIVYE